MPKPRVLNLISCAGKFSEDWERGKDIQREYGLDLVPPTCECEIGAGFWDRITNGEWKAALSTPSGREGGGE